MNQNGPTTLPRPSVSGSAYAADHSQTHRRMFLGPIPYNIRETEHGDDEASDFVSQHGLRIFLQQGGHLEEWTEVMAREYKDRLKQRILESTAWHTIAMSSSRRKKKRRSLSVEWRGDTFEIGKVAGLSVNMLATPEETMSYLQDVQQSSDRSLRKSKSAATVHWDESSRTPFFTARSTISDVTSPSSDGSARPQLRASQSEHVGQPLSDISEDSNGHANQLDESTSSKTRLFSDTVLHSIPREESAQSQRLRGAKSEGDLSKKQGPGLKSILGGPDKSKGKGKAVRYAEPSSTTKHGGVTLHSGCQDPAPPEEVLGRSPSEIEGSSAAAAADTVALEPTANTAVGDDDADTTSVVQRDRMLVSVFRCERETLKFPFTEKESRVTRGLDSKEWDEFLVIWRNQRIEIYEDYHTPCKERILGHKHLAFAIPLSDPRTRLSLFSSVDMTFCIVCPPTPTKYKKDRGRRWIFHRSSRGLNVFIFKHKSRSRALDWIWSLWMVLGGEIPDHVEVDCPLVHARVKIPIPETDEGWRSVTPDYMIDQCKKAMEGSFAWQTIVQLPILNGRRLELCWQSDTRLDWVWLKDGVDGRKREWEVLFGIAMNYLGSPTQLELHLASHYLTRVAIEDGKHLEEPPSIEGYVFGIKRKTQARVQYYLSTHDGYLFAIQVEKVVTPPTPTDIKTFARSEEELNEDENVRLRTQIMNAKWFWDLRSVLLVRRAMYVTHQVRDTSIASAIEVSHRQDALDHEARPEVPDLTAAPDITEHIQRIRNEEAELRRSDSDVGDEGGEGELAHARDRGRMRMYRSFELVLKNGRILRFECHSTKVAVEWVAHLRALVQYWTKRYREDTNTEMDIKDSLGEDRITFSKRDYKNWNRIPIPSAPDRETASLYMDQFWHWCVLEGCRQIVKSGKVYMKKKFRAQYRHAHLVLTRGCLVQFKVTNDFSLHNHQMGRINLLDAYVCSGYYAATALSYDEFDPNAPPVAKYFPDGLETRDLSEDTLFMLWYRPHSVGDTTITTSSRSTNSKDDLDIKRNHDRSDDLNKVPIPNMSAKHKVVIFRARSKLERDAWCWALNCEIERLVRRAREREKRMREQGMPV